jgi:predicted permease
VTLAPWCIRLCAWLVPRADRDDWRREWTAELAHRGAEQRTWPGSFRSRAWRLTADSSGAIRDALWLRSSRWHTGRALAQHWRVSTAVALSLAVALAATIVAGGLYDALLLRPPGVPSPETLYTISAGSPAYPFDHLSREEFRTLAARTGTLSGVTAYVDGVSTTSAPDVHRRLVTMPVAKNYFDVLGVHAEIGSLTFPAGTDGDASVVLSDALWRRMGAPQSIIGTRFRLDKSTLTVVGVAPASFAGMTLVWKTDAWVPLDASPAAAGSHDVYLLARLAPGDTLDRAQAELTGLSATILNPPGVADRDRRRARLAPARVLTDEARADAQPLLLAIVGLAALTLIAAGANAATLLVGLAITRRHELLVRAALGASRAQLMAPRLRESLTLAAISGVVGFALAYSLLATLSTHGVSFGGDVPPPSLDVRPDLAVTLVAAVLVVVVGLAVGLVPAWRSASDGTSGGLTHALVATDGRRGWSTGVLIAVQTAVTTMVLVGAAVSWRGVANLSDVDLGFSQRHLAVAQLTMPGTVSTVAARREMATRTREAVAEVPGVESASIASGMPMDLCCDASIDVRTPASAVATGAPVNVVDDRFFGTIGLRAIDGRTFTARDDAHTDKVVVINQLMAAAMWPGRRAVGESVLLGDDRQRATVVGVVANAKYEDLDEPERPLLYVDFAQSPLTDVAVIARTSGPSPRLAPAIARAIARVTSDDDPWVHTLEDNLTLQLALPRVMWRGLGGLGALALLLTSVGLYGMVFAAVGRRRREIGIRVALGAQARDVLGLVLRRTLAFSVGGALAGTAIGAIALPIVASLFYGVSPTSAGLVALAGTVSVVVATIVATVAARRWTRVSAMEILRAPQ